MTKKILLIDDSPTQLLAFRRAVQESGLEVVTALVSSVAEVLNLARIVSDEQPDVGLVDVDLGIESFDGSRLASSFVRLKKTTPKPMAVVLHSGLEPERLDELTRKSGADTYLEKGKMSILPMRLQTLLALWQEEAGEVEWLEEMSTGVDKLDEKQKEFVEVLNRLIFPVRDGRGQEPLASVLDWLDRHTLHYFADEEAFMTSYDCPAARVNALDHRRFEAQVSLLQERLRREGASQELAEELLDQLSLWLINHVQRVDVRLRAAVENVAEEDTLDG